MADLTLYKLSCDLPAGEGLKFTVLILLLFPYVGFVSFAQVDTIERYFPVFDKLRKTFFIGEMIWNFADFMTQQGWYPSFSVLYYFRTLNNYINISYANPCSILFLHYVEYG